MSIEVGLGGATAGVLANPSAAAKDDRGGAEREGALCAHRPSPDGDGLAPNKLGPLGSLGASRPDRDEAPQIERAGAGRAFGARRVRPAPTDPSQSRTRTSR